MIKVPYSFFFESKQGDKSVIPFLKESTCDDARMMPRCDTVHTQEFQARARARAS